MTTEEIDSPQRMLYPVCMSRSRKFLTLVVFALIAGGIILVNNQRPSTIDQLESRFINTTTEEKQELVGHFQESEITDIDRSIAAYKEIHLPRIDAEIESTRNIMQNAAHEDLKKMYKDQLKRLLKERIVYRDTLVGYQQLRTWYYENKQGILGGNFEDVEIVSGEAGL